MPFPHMYLGDRRLLISRHVPALTAGKFHEAGGTVSVNIDDSRCLGLLACILRRSYPYIFIPCDPTASPDTEPTHSPHHINRSSMAKLVDSYSMVNSIDSDSCT